MASADYLGRGSHRIAAFTPRSITITYRCYGSAGGYYAPDFDAIRIGFEFGVGLSASASAKLHSAYLMHKICNTIHIYAENIWKSEKIFKNNLFFQILLLPL